MHLGGGGGCGIKAAEWCQSLLSSCSDTSRPPSECLPQPGL